MRVPAITLELRATCLRQNVNGASLPQHPFDIARKGC
jgi:hypothetical protein